MWASMGAMAPDSNPVDSRDDPADAAALRTYADDLAAGIDRALAPWVVSSVARVVDAWRAAGGPVPDPAIHDQARAAGERCRAELGPVVAQVLAADIDAQRVNPLAVVRRAVPYPTAVLRAAGVPPLRRDPQAVEHFPDDDYDLTPGSFADLDPRLHEPGLRWGAAKAHVHLQRRRADGQR